MDKCSSLKSSAPFFSRSTVRVRRVAQTRRWTITVSIGFVVASLFLLMIDLVTGSKKPFDLGQFLDLVQAVIALIAMCIALCASLHQPQVQARIANDAADESFYRTISSMVVIGRQFGQIVEDAPHHVLNIWQAKVSADLLAQMRSGMLFSFPDSSSLEATLAAIIIGEELLSDCTEASPEALDELGGEAFRQRKLQLSKLRIALDELALHAVSWDLEAEAKGKQLR